MKILIIFFILSLLINATAQTKGERTLKLEEACLFALQHNPAYQAQLQKIKYQEAVYQFEMSPENPTIGIEVEEIPGGQKLSSYGEKRLFISQNFDFPTNYLFLHQQRSADIEKEIAQTEIQKRDIKFQVHETYFSIKLQEALIDLARKNVELSNDFYEKSKRIYNLGETDRLTMLKAKVNAGIAQQNLNSTQHELKTANARFREVMGIQAHEYDQIILIDSLLDSITFVTPARTKARLTEHPVLKIAELTQLSAKAARREAYSKLLPEISLTYFQQEIDKKNFWGGEIGLSFPLWFWKQTGLIQQKRSEVKISEAFYLAEKLKLEREFDEAFVYLEKAIQEVNLYQSELLNEATEVFRIAEKSYSVGEIGYLEFIDAQQTLIQSNASYLHSLYNYQIQKANLIRLTGEK
ncbi:TolC family protein [candidate division KSB1 bacterium]|nr:TolC family protein [candidate division KSB1 bacterium]